MSKAFDRLNHEILFHKLLDAGLPKLYVRVLVDWYSKLSICVRWDNITSAPRRIESGVRQGGILSPYLYALYVNDVLLVLEKSKLGCRIMNKLFNVIMYADDILLLSISSSHLQALVDICVTELSKLG